MKIPGWKRLCVISFRRAKPAQSKTVCFPNFFPALTLNRRRSCSPRETRASTIARSGNGSYRFASLVAHRDRTADYFRLMRVFSTLLWLCFALSASAENPKILPLMPAPPKALRAEKKALVALPNYDEETATRLQIFLDNNDFGPGKIDGEMGEFFRKALLAYKRANGMPLNGALDQSFLNEVPEPYTTWTIPPEAENFVGPAPTKPSEQAKLKALKYGSLLELVCERYHAAEAFVRKINKGLNLDQLKPGDTVRVPNVNPFKIEDLHEGFMPDRPEFAQRKVVVDTHERFLEIHEGDKLVAEFPI